MTTSRPTVTLSIMKGPDDADTLGYGSSGPHGVQEYPPE